MYDEMKLIHTNRITVYLSLGLSTSMDSSFPGCLEGVLVAPLLMMQFSEDKNASLGQDTSIPLTSIVTGKIEMLLCQLKLLKNVAS